MVRKRTLVSGRFFLMCRAASKGESPAMPISISTISGRRSRAFSTASPALGDSPTTSKSDSLSSSRRTPWRNSVWSSTSKHLIFGILIFLSSKGSAAKIRLRYPRAKLAQHGAHFSLTLSSKGSAAKIRLRYPRAKLAQHGAHFSLTLSSKGSAAKIRLLHPREKLAQHGAHFSLTLSSKGSAAKIRLLHPREKLAQHGAHFSLTLSARVNPRQSQTAPRLQHPVQVRAR